MPRPPRFTYPRAVHHVTLRCNNREFLFADPWFARFVELLQEARASFPIRLFHYCVMTNHVHLLFQVGHADTLPKVMHWLSTTLVRRFNKATGRTEFTRKVIIREEALLDVGWDPDGTADLNRFAVPGTDGDEGWQI